jgi:hypothetical protein
VSSHLPNRTIIIQLGYPKLALLALPSPAGDLQGRVFNQRLGHRGERVKHQSPLFGEYLALAKLLKFPKSFRLNTVKATIGNAK